MLEHLKRWIAPKQTDEQLQAKLEKVRKQAPIPAFWLYGKTQSGKTSLIKFLTGADEAEIGEGFRPCTRFSREYAFPTADAPLVKFLDTRGMDEPGYDPREDIARFAQDAHVVVVTVKAMDHALENLLAHLRPIRQAQPTRPVVLALTCLHEAYPQKQHPQPYPFDVPEADIDWSRVPDNLRVSLTEQRRRFAGLFDQCVPIDLTQPIDGLQEQLYGGEHLRGVLLDALPAAYRQTLLTLEQATKELQDLFARRALPHIVGYSTLAASAGAIPIPWVDLLILPGIQTQMIYHLARLYGQPLSGQRFLELAGTLGMGMVVRQAVREVVKFIPFVGSVAGAALAGAATFALGKSFCYYYSAVCKGHVPQPDDLKRYYHEQLSLAEKFWRKEAERPAATQSPSANP
jgi:uncharacterized protein (DUF697 family)/predicted GTPase